MLGVSFSFRPTRTASAGESWPWLCPLYPCPRHKTRSLPHTTACALMSPPAVASQGSVLQQDKVLGGPHGCLRQGKNTQK